MELVVEAFRKKRKSRRLSMTSVSDAINDTSMSIDLLLTMYCHSQMEVNFHFLTIISHALYTNTYYQDTNKTSLIQLS